MNPETLAEKVKDARFVCACCGACCSGPDNEVIVAPQEIERIMHATGESFDEIAEPYPEWFEEQGERFTFSWILRRGADGNCRFLRDGRCTVYADRPDICRTYPFMLDRGELLISECPALGKTETENPFQIAEDLIAREQHDDAEIAAARREYQKHSMVAGATVVIDSRGVHPRTIE
ncbi:MAG TPA: YkgJ family cysteine cluster protein [Methanocorpusculum sp.]|nr:YkgJ family cysteine cluster protein [Methanocorpusculum sp.]